MKKLLAALGQKISQFVMNILVKKPTVEEISKTSVIVLDKIRSIVYSNTVKDVTEAFPGDWDNKLVEQAKSVLERAANFHACAHQPDLISKLRCYFDAISLKEEAERALAWHGLAALIGNVAADGKLTISDLFIGVEWAFRELFPKKVKA
jgi:hypothetical protein